MVAFIIRRTLAALLVLFGVSILIFTLVKITPGDPARAQLPATATPDQIRALQHAMGLDRPLPGQYITWLTNALQGDLGLSYQHRISAISLVRERFGNTLILAGSALTVAVLFGVTIGVIAGTRPNSFVDRFLTLLAVAAASVPTYWLGIVLLIIFSLKLHWFPATGMYNARVEPTLPDLLRHLVLPTITTAAVPTAIIARMVRSSVQETMTLDHVRTARAKGLSERAVVTRHALRNALPTFVTIIALQAGYLMGGSLIAEIVFSWPGIGLQVYTAVGARDIPIIMSVTLLVAVIFVSLNFLADLVQAIADPRIRLA
jgi:peptide/nickel transport system permease protein